MNIIPVFCSFDKNMLLPAKVWLFSLLSNADETTEYDVWILYKQGTLSDLEQREFDSIISNTHHRISFYGIGDIFDNCFEIRGITTAAYYRLYIPLVVQDINLQYNKSYGKVIYIDVDTIVECDLWNIFSTVHFSDDLWIAGVKEPLSYWLDYYPQYLIDNSVNPEEYINSGFLIIDTERLIRFDFFEHCKRHLNKQYICQDQDIINIVCNHHVIYISLKYNFTSLLYARAYIKKDDKLLIERKKELAESLYSVVHFAGRKPWKEFVRRGNIWWYYYQKSPFFNCDEYTEYYDFLESNSILHPSGRQLIKAFKSYLKNKRKYYMSKMTLSKKN